MSAVSAGLAALLNARTVAVVGASPNNGVTANIFAWASAMGDKVDYWPVNPKYPEVAGRRAYPSLNNLPGSPDVVAIAVAGKALAGLVDQAVAVGARGLVAYADLRQSPSSEMVGLRQRLRDRNIPLIGSNCMGALSVRRGLALYSGDVNSRLLAGGSIGFVSQSGSIMIGMISAAPRALYSSLFSVGNEDVTSAADYIAFLADDDDTRVIGCFLETIRNPEEFRRAARRAGDNGKPVVALTVGKSSASRENAATHSGALAPDSAVLSAFLVGCGVIEVSSVEALIETVIAFQSPRRPTGRAVGMVHVSGGQASLQLDCGNRNGLTFPKLGGATLQGLAASAPWLQAPQNPIDAWGPPSYRESYPPALAALAADEAIDIVVSNQDMAQFVSDPGSHVTRAIADALIVSISRHKKPAFMISNVALGFDDAITSDLRVAQIPLLVGADAGYEALGHWTDFHLRPPPDATAAPAVAAALDLRRAAGAMDEIRSLEFLGRFGLQAPRMIEAADESAAVGAATKIGYPVVLKGVGPTLLHKTEAGAVAVGIRSEVQLREALAKMRAAPAAGAIESFVVVEQIERHRELLLGAHRDPQLGIAVLLGVGGVMAEIIADVRIMMSPITRPQAEAMVAGLRSRAWLDRWRHLEPADVDALVETILAFDRAVAALGDRLESIDVNPIAVREQGEGCVMLDAVVVLREKS